MNWASATFLVSSGFALYVLAGYPLALSVVAHLRPKPIRKRFDYQPEISVLIPVRNGERWIEAKLNSVLGTDYPGHLISILVISDGSTDATDALVSGFPDSRVRLLRLPWQGKANAVNRALEAVGTEVVVLTDVRQTFDRAAISKLVACLGDPSVGVVTGELVIRDGNSSEEFNTGLYWKYEKWIRRNLNRLDVMLGATGAIYAMRRSLARPMPEDTLLDDVYLPFAAAFQGQRIYFEDEARAYDFPTSLQSEFRRKVRTQAGVYQIMRQFPQLLWPGNKRFIHFFSHKLGRLLLPFAMIAAFLSSLFLPTPWHWPMVTAQIGFYGAALLDPILPEGNPLKRITAIIRAFLVLVAAALCAVSILFRPAQQLWKQTQVQGTRSA